MAKDRTWFLTTYRALTRGRAVRLTDNMHDQPVKGTIIYSDL